MLSLVDDDESIEVLCRSVPISRDGEESSFECFPCSFKCFSCSYEVRFFCSRGSI